MGCIAWTLCIQLDPNPHYRKALPMAIISPTMSPMVTMNGTPKIDLLNARVNAWHALSSAIDAMYPLLPHGRDYIPNPAQMGVDRDIHFARLALLDGMRNALLDEYKTLTKEA